MKLELSSAIAAMCLFAATPAYGVMITPDYSGLGTVYQDATGQLFTTAAVGRTDVTGLFKTDVNAAIQYLQNSILLNWSETITFTLADLSGPPAAVADSTNTGIDANGRPSSSAIRVDTSSSVFFFDPTPLDNSEFTMTSATTMLGGSSVNVSRFGNATATGGAAGRWDFLTIAIHEIEHSIGYASGLARFTDVAGATGTANRKITVPTTLTGFASAFDIPIVSGSAHIDGTAMMGVFNDAVVAEPGFGIGQRALPTAVEIYGLCVIEGCTAAQVNPNPLPEPGTILLLSGALPVVILMARRRTRV
jgi:hypothetical protein